VLLDLAFLMLFLRLYLCNTKVPAKSFVSACARKGQNRYEFIFPFTAETGITPTLQYVDLSLVSLQECKNAYGPRPTTQYCCSGAEIKSTCNVSF